MRYSIQNIVDHEVEVIRLVDAGHGVEVAIVPSIGNRAFEMRVNGKNILYFPFANVGEFKREPTLFNGIPFLAPWANRMAGGGFQANGETYRFNESLGTLRMDANGVPIHGMLSASSLWEPVSSGADEVSAWATSRLEFWKYPDLMANWPFAHEYEMTYRLTEGVLEVSTTVLNRSAMRMPVAIGFHPYFEMPDTRREDAFAHIPARKHVETNAQLVATGECTPVELPERASLREYHFDDGFIDLSDSLFYLEAAGKRIEVRFGPKYRVAVVYAPASQNYICFEPMSCITNGVNLAAEGKYQGLQWVAAGESWQESFRIGTRGI